MRSSRTDPMHTPRGY